MKKLLILIFGFVVLLILSEMSFAQEATAAVAATDVATVEAPAVGSPQILPFGYPPYPTVGDHPAYGVPYSYPRVARRLGSRLTPPVPYQPYALPTPGAVEGAVPPVANPAPPTFRNRALPPRQGTLGAIPPAGQPGQPTVFYRPTPIKNFVTLVTAPRPYIGYNPYAGYPPAPAFVPPQQ